jgi:hypothetical protein
MGARERKVVNGVVVGTAASVPKQNRARIRAALHHLRVDEISEKEREERLDRLKGSINYLATINPSQAGRFQDQLTKLLDVPSSS